MTRFVLGLVLGLVLGSVGTYLADHPQITTVALQKPEKAAAVPAADMPAAPIAGLPNARLTPGALNPNVTQANIDSTICVRGWTRTIRPPEAYTEQLKREQIREYGYADRRLGHYEEDHLISLELGGSPTDPHNLWPEPHDVAGGWGSFTKDRLENALHEMVCEHRITLAQARGAIAQNWIAAYERVFPGQPGKP